MRFVILCALGLCNLYGMGFSHANSHHPQEFLKKIAGKKQEGRDIVEHYCATCHAEKPLIPLGAPRMGVPKDVSEKREALYLKLRKLNNTKHKVILV